MACLKYPSLSSTAFSCAPYLRQQPDHRAFEITPQNMAMRRTRERLNITITRLTKGHKRIVSLRAKRQVSRIHSATAAESSGKVIPFVTSAASSPTSSTTFGPLSSLHIFHRYAILVPPRGFGRRQTERVSDPPTGVYSFPRRA